MSVEEMCHIIELWAYQGDYHISRQRLDSRNKKLDSIVAALRAGQDMRQMLTEIANPDSLVCCQAWDEATKEETR